MTGEAIRTLPEELSNRRLMYETFVTALRQTSDAHTDAHRVYGNTNVTGSFIIDDYLYFDVCSKADRMRPNNEVRSEILENRRPLISISFASPDEDSVTHGYLMAYPEDIREGGGLVGSQLLEALPEDWPANEPFIVGSHEDNNAGTTRYDAVLEPFNEQWLRAAYDGVPAAMSELHKTRAESEQRWLLANEHPVKRTLRNTAAYIASLLKGTGNH